MASVGTLYGTETSVDTQRIKAVCALAGLKIDNAQGYKHYEDNKTEAFLKKFASGKIPAFEDAEGWTLFEGISIARYLASLAPNSGLLGFSPKEVAQVDQWTHYIESEVQSVIRPIAHMLLHRLPYQKGQDLHYREQLARPLGVLNKHLETRTYFVGERITIADLTAASGLVAGFKSVIDAKEREKYPHIVRHYNTIRGIKKLKDIWGETEWVETAKQYQPPAKEKKEEKPKAEKAPKAPKAEKKPAAKEADDEEDEPSVPAEPKAKNPLDDLPKSNFNLEDWKRAYSNLDTRGAGGSLEWFHEKFDPEGFSLWRVDFKYPEELTQVFMSSNLVGGFFNRLEGSRKYLFGSMGVLGSANDSLISGAFIARGPDAKPVFDVAPDWESYDFKKLDLSNKDDKEYFEAALAWDLEINGKKWADGKAFK